MFVRGISRNVRTGGLPPIVHAARGPRQQGSGTPVPGPGHDLPPRFLSAVILGKVFTISGIISEAFAKDSVPSGEGDR